MLKTPLENGTIIKINIGTKYDKQTDTVSGNIELDIENQAHFVELVTSIFEEGSSKIIINMTNISYIDSSGLWALFEGHKKATQRNGKMVLLNPTKDVKRVLDITKMSSKIEVFKSESAAINRLKA